MPGEFNPLNDLRQLGEITTNDAKEIVRPLPGGVKNIVETLGIALADRMERIPVLMTVARFLFAPKTRR